MSNYSKLQGLNYAPSSSLLPKLPSFRILENNINVGSKKCSSLHMKHHHYFPTKYRKSSVLATSRDVKPATATVTSAPEKRVKVKAVVTVQVTAGGLFSNLSILTRPVDDIADLLGRTLLLELVSNQLDSRKHYYTTKPHQQIFFTTK